MSGDAEQEFFADGITEDIITELSRFRELFVISRNSSFKYKGQPVEVQKFARELGVQYVVEGSVRKVGKRVRITVQLIDAETDRHLWAERYDRDLEDIFAIQDEVTSVDRRHPARARRGGVARPRRAQDDRQHGGLRVRAHRQAAAPPQQPRRQRRARWRCSSARSRSTRTTPTPTPGRPACSASPGSTTGARIAPTLEPVIVAELEPRSRSTTTTATCTASWPRSTWSTSNFDQCLYHQQRALSLNPNDDLVVVQQGEILTWLGQAEEGIEWIKKAMRLNPYHPERFWSHLGRAYFVARRYAEALEALKRVRTPDAGAARPSSPPARRGSATLRGRAGAGAASCWRCAAVRPGRVPGDAALPPRGRPRAPSARAWRWPGCSAELARVRSS